LFAFIVECKLFLAWSWGIGLGSNFG
jgi:hypothetical protein